MTELQFMVCPDFLRNEAFVRDPVRVIITDPDSIFITGILGESGRRMIRDGAPFIFTRALADKLIAHGVAALANSQVSNAARSGQPQ